MEGFRNSNSLPSIAIAQVGAYDVINHAVYVTLISGQQISESIRVLYNGNADALRINQEPLPLIGTWGLIAIPNGDIRAALWIGAFYPSAQNAITTSVPPTDEDTQTKYYSHWSGAYWLIDPEGQSYFWSPDGTNFLINSNNNAPILYRHIINSNNQQQTIEFSNSSRNPTPPNPYYVTLNHPSEAYASISPIGVVTIQGGKPQLASMTINASGVVTIQTGTNGGSGVQVGPTAVLDPQQGLITITGANSYSSISMNVSGQVVVTSANGNGVIQMDQNGNIIATANQKFTINATNNDVEINATNGDIVFHTDLNLLSIDQLVNIFNAHVHSGVSTGTSDTGVPTTPLP